MNAAPETTQYFPKPGRTPPARLHVVPNPFQENEHTACVRPTGNATWKDILRMRGELPEPKPRVAKRNDAPAAFIPPYLRKGYRWDLLGDALHAAMRRESSKGATIRTTPKNLAALLKTAEWKGARIAGTVASPEIGQAERAVSECAGRVAESERDIAEVQALLAAPDVTDRVRQSLEIRLGTATSALAQRQSSLNDARNRLDMVRAEEWIHVVHPSGAELKIRPQWGK